MKFTKNEHKHIIRSYTYQFHPNFSQISLNSVIGKPEAMFIRTTV